MSALERVLTEPVMTVAPWTVGRSILETSGLAMWLLDPSLTAPLRVARGLTLRLYDLREQLTIVRNESRLNPIIPQIDARIANVSSQAQRYGLPEKRNKKGLLLSFGENLPSETELAKRAFNAETMYRMLSAAEHNRTWAILQLSTRLAERNQMVPHLSVEGAFGLTVSSLGWYARPVWNLFQLNGWDLPSLGEILDSQFDQAGIGENGKFWKSRPSLTR